jgi:hypothetical protein
VARTTSGYDAKGKPTYGVSTGHAGSSVSTTPAVTNQTVIATAAGINDPKWLALQKELEAKVAHEKKEAELAAAERSRNELKARELALKEKEAEERIERQRNKHEVEEARRLAMANNGKVKGPAKTTVKADAETPAEESALDVTNRPVRDKWALIVGISNFQDSKLNLKYPAKDAKDFNDYLLKEGHFAADHVKLLTNEQATRANILSELGDKWLPRVANPDDLVVIYISSHGSASDMDIGGVTTCWHTTARSTVSTLLVCLCKI